MRYFLIVSISLHAAFFAAWDTHDIPGYSDRPIAISLLINNDVASQEIASQKQSTKRHSGNLRTNGIPHTIGTPVPLDGTISIAEETDGQAKTPDATDISINDLRDNSDEISQTRHTPPLSLPGGRIEAYLRRALTPYFTYPRLAREKGWQGTVELAVNINARGLLTRVRVVHSSGYGILDHAALNSIRHVRLLPDAADLLDHHGLEVNFPVKYQLVDT